MTTHNTEIQWTHVPGYRGETWNPWTGCTKVSPGCAHCYIEDTPPFRKAGKVFVNGKIPITIYPDRLRMPLRWKKPRAVFVNSMSDLFHEDVPLDVLTEVFNVMGQARQHIFMVLTKRPERMVELIEDIHETLGWSVAEPLPNVWLGVTIENRRMVHRADLLRQTPAAVRFISAEPLLGPLVPDAVSCPDSHHPVPVWSDASTASPLDLTGIDWLIVGGESGSKHRRIEESWVRDLLAATRCSACDGTGVGDHGADPDPLCLSCMGEPRRTAFFFKQWGGHTPKAGGRELDGRTWDEFPSPSLATT
jgi:protein gp37